MSSFSALSFKILIGNYFIKPLLSALGLLNTNLTTPPLIIDGVSLVHFPPVNKWILARAQREERRAQCPNVGCIVTLRFAFSILHNEKLRCACQHAASDVTGITRDRTKIKNFCKLLMIEAAVVQFQITMNELVVVKTKKSSAKVARNTRELQDVVYGHYALQRAVKKLFNNENSSILTLLDSKKLS